MKENVIKKRLEELPYLESDANKIKFIINKLQEKLTKTSI